MINSSLEKLNQIKSEYTEFLKSHGNSSETDTRIKLIDRILKEVLLWPESSISREDHVSGDKSGYTDYIFTLRSKKIIVAEAKRSSVIFELPPQPHHKRLKLKTLLSQKGDLSDAIKQTREYCDELNIRYGITTNGTTWVIFRAIREDIPWKDGSARIFYDFDDMVCNFYEFWGLISYDSLSNFLIDTEFSSHVFYKRSNKRILDQLHSPDAPLERNRLHVDLDKIINAFFKDIADRNLLDILNECYIHSKSLKNNSENLRSILSDRIPFFIRSEDTYEVLTGKVHAGIFGKKINDKVIKNNSELLLILGGIGSGKTTFIKRYIRIIGSDLLTEKTCWFYIDFLSAPNNPNEILSFIYSQILNNIRMKYSNLFVENRKTIKKVFKDKIDNIHETNLKLHNYNPNDYEIALSPFLEDWQKDINDYTKRILKLLQNRERVIILCIDNVDQLPKEIQTSIFLSAQHVTKEVGSITFLSLREETFFSSRTQKTFTAYTNQKYHISSPNFLKLIGRRINYAIESLSKPDEALRLILESEPPRDKTSISNFLKIVSDSIFQNNKNIHKFIFSLCYNNMRQALDFFSLFLISGATDVDKMLRIYAREGSYTIPFHEFIKSILLGYRKYYKESESHILNLYTFSNNKNASHFTSFRILNYLLLRQSVHSEEGKGYVSIDEMLLIFDDTFNNREDVIFWCNRFVSKTLLEVNTHSTENIDNAILIRITPSGWYYLRYLSLKFAYIDLVVFDTPIENSGIVNQLFQLTVEIEKIPNTDDFKIDKTKKRFERVDVFIKYLKEQERQEYIDFPNIISNDEFKNSIVDSISLNYETDKKWIFSRLSENQRLFDEYVFLKDYEDQLFEENINFINEVDDDSQ